MIRIAEAQAAIAESGERSVRVLQRGPLDVVLGTPARPDAQTAHEQDEVYIVVRGRGILFHDGKRDQLEAGDFLFVAAATEHRFEDRSDDLLGNLNDPSVYFTATLLGNGEVLVVGGGEGEEKNLV